MKMWFRPSFIIWSFLKFIFNRNFPISNKNSLEMPEMHKNFDIFEFAVNYEPFSNRSLQYFFKSLLDYQIDLCGTFAFLRTRKRFKLHKNKDVETFRLVWRDSEVFLKQNAATFSSKKVVHRSFSHS